MANILERVLSQFGYRKADAIQADWLRMSALDEQYSIPDRTMPEAQMELYKRLSWVHSAVSSVARQGATTGFAVSKMVGEKTNAIENHPFELLLRRPNPLVSRFELLEATISDHGLTGNAFWWLNRANEKAAPDEIWTIPPHRVRPVPDGRMFLKGYLYTTDAGEEIPLERWEVVHFKRYNPLSPFVGLSPIEALATVATGDLAQQRWNTNYFDKNNAKTEGAMAFSDFIDDATWAKIKADIKARHGGTNREMMMLRNAGKGGVQWIPMSMSQKDMEFLQGRTFNKEEIFGIYAPGLASLLAVNATEANSKAGKATFREMAVWPQLVALSEKITNDLLPIYGDNLVGEFDDIRLSDRGMELAEQNAASQVLTIDELRQQYHELGPLADDRGTRLLSEPLPKSGNDSSGLQIHDYHINSGVITKAEAREYYGLPATDNMSPTELEAKFKAVAAGEAIGIPAERVFALVGLDANLLPTQRAVTVVQPQARQLTDSQQGDRTQPAEQPQAQAQDANDTATDAVMQEAMAEAKALRKWLKRRPNADPADFTVSYLSDEQFKAIVADVRGVEDSTAEDAFFCQSYP